MAGAGLNQDQIAKAVGVSEPTRRKHYGEQIGQAAAVNLGKVAKRLYDLALGDDPRASLGACIFIMKCRGGWKPGPDMEVTATASATASNAPPPPTVTLSPEQDKALEALVSDIQSRVRIPSLAPVK